jgi:hypothetical protein
VIDLIGFGGSRKGGVLEMGALDWDERGELSGSAN